MRQQKQTDLVPDNDSSDQKKSIYAGGGGDDSGSYCKSHLGPTS